jgi:hypothetical protein
MWIIVDVRTGLVDGYYQSEPKQYAVDFWKRRLGHEDVVVAKVESTRPIGRCFMPDAIRRGIRPNEEAYPFLTR